MKYFEESIEYPKITGEILKHGVYHTYISSTFLNGFVNYFKPIKAFVLGRYLEWDEGNDSSTDGMFEQSLHVDNKWIPTKFSTKSDLYDALIVPGAVCHVECDIDFQDDVLILSKDENTEGDYVFFWYDRDCSDCCICRFHTDDTIEEVIETFTEFVKSGIPNYNEHGEREIPLTYFSGWISG